MKKAYSILLSCAVLFSLVNCGIQITDSQVPASQTPVSGENEQDTQSTDIAIKNSKGEASLPPSPPLVPTLVDDNPYAMNIEHLDFWYYFIYEAFRGVSQLRFTDWLEYHHESLPKDDRGYFSFDISYPFIDDDTALAHGVNSFFEDRYSKMLDSEQDFQHKYADEICLNYYNQTVYDYYQWGAFFIIIGAHDYSFGRTFCDPIGFNFDIRTGQHLNFSDLFSVEASVYEQRLIEAIKTIDAAHKPEMYPGFIHGNSEFPLPENHYLSLNKSQDEYFMIAPIGIVFLYPNGVICNRGGGGQTSQFIPYEKIVDILNPDLFGECLDEAGRAIL
jgi:hypothetical protein